MPDPEAAALREPAQRVSPRARLMWMTAALAQSVILMAGVVFVVDPYVVDLPWWVEVALGVVLAAYVVVMPLWRYAVHRWEVTDTAVYTQTGWWVLERRIAPMSRIQTVDLSVGAISRLFRLATVTVTTASAAGALDIVGLDGHVARRLVDELTLKADAVEGDAT
jgi:membrane protein YdbS with pleckstrin-like domain